MLGNFSMVSLIDCERTINTYRKLNTYYAKFFNASEFVYILQKSLKGT